MTAVLIQRQTGGDLSEVLKNISGMIRQRIRLQQQVKAKTAEGRFTGYLLTAFPAVMFVITYAMNPKYGGVLVNTSMGLQMLGAAFTMQILGLFVIRKITTVKVDERFWQLATRNWQPCLLPCTPSRTSSSYSV